MTDKHAPHRFESKLTWTGAKSGPTSDYASYSREYEVAIAGKPTLVASSAPAYRGDAALHNPEDHLLAALSGCHCLSYLALCAMSGIRVVAYEDEAVGIMSRQDGKIRFVDVLLRPIVTVEKGVDVARAKDLHVRAHAECFIANSVNFPVRNEPSIRAQGDEVS